MTTQAADPVLIQRCAAILHERAKHGSGPIDALNMSHLLGVPDYEAYRALNAIPGVIVQRSQAKSTLDRFSLP